LALGAVAVVVASTASACSQSAGDGPPSVIAGAYPLAEMARQLVPDGVEVLDLTRPGSEPHDAELTTDQLDAIDDADLVLYVSDGFQPAVARAATRAGSKVSALEAVGGDDPHVWLDPVAMVEVVEATAGALERAGLGEGVTQRKEELVERLRSLDRRFRSGLDECATTTIVSVHDAFGRLAGRYGLEAEALTGTSPEGEPNPQRLDALRQMVRDRRLTTVFSESATPPASLATLARETGTTAATLDTLESARPGRDPGYFVRMDANLATLARGLGCL
jgi:zinc transport system substrate-binding protein